MNTFSPPRNSHPVRRNRNEDPLLLPSDRINWNRSQVNFFFVLTDRPHRSLSHLGTGATAVLSRGITFDATDQRNQIGG